VNREDQVAQNDCEHHYSTHMRGGEPLSVRICTLCGEVDWADLREQVERIRDAAMLIGQHRTVLAFLGDRPLRPPPEEEARVRRELAREGLEPGVPAVPANDHAGEQQ
jgi:hypothetical protein